MDRRYAKRVGEFLDEFRSKVQALPSVQLTPLATTEALTARASASSSAFEANRVFWSDQLAALEAWRSIFGWRMLELLNAAAALRNECQFVACAPVTRAAFELAQEALVTSGQLWEVLQQITPEKVRTHLHISTTFPEHIELAIFGSTIRDRVKAVGVQHPPRLKNARGRLQEHKRGGEVSKYYEKISDLAHPYWLGNRPFYRQSRAGTIEKVCREYDEVWAAEIGEDLDTMISWTAKAASNVLDQTDLGLRNTRTALGDV
jgi:hypothetical protein